jgi:hypothetical protein
MPLGARTRPLRAFVLASAVMHGLAFGVLGPARSHGGEAPAALSVRLTGDTLDVEAPLAEWSAPSADEGVDEPHELGSSPPADTADPARPRRRSLAALGLPLSTGHVAAAPSPPPALFGAVGDRSAADLATAFTRAFPQAASADPVWSGAPLGLAGHADLALTLDDAGRLVARAIEGAPSPALHRGIDRTLALLGARAFTARALTTRLRIVARVTPDAVHDGLHGDVFALSGGSFAGDVGTAFFALPPRADGTGRRIDVQIRILR